ADAPGHITYLGGTDFLITNGSTGMQRLSWPGKEWEMKKEVQLPDRIAAAPLLLPPAQPDAVPLVCVVGSKGTLMLLKSDDLSTVRTWELNGSLTAGPFLRGKYIGLILERRQLVLIDPDKPETPAWTYQATAESIIGEPQQVGDLLILVDQAG